MTHTTDENSDLFDLHQFRGAFEALPAHLRASFLAAVRQDLKNGKASLQAAIAANDREAADRQAHAIKGVAGNVGAIGLLYALSEFRGSDLDLDSESCRNLEAKIAATLDACGALYQALIEG